MSKKSAHDAQAENAVALDDPAPSAKRPSSGDGVCAPNVCALGDHGEKWSGMTNFTCTREGCSFATVNEGIARERNPKAFEPSR